jgi:hypothetical protein
MHPLSRHVLVRDVLKGLTILLPVLEFTLKPTVSPCCCSWNVRDTHRVALPGMLGSLCCGPWPVLPHRTCSQRVTALPCWAIQ